MLKIANREFKSRLFVGTGKFSSNDLMRKAIDASGTEMVTMALRRVDLNDTGNDAFLNSIDRTKFQFLPNTSGARSADEAVRLAKLSRAATGINWLKLEITPDPYSLMPDPVETLFAAERLVKEGFIVLPYINADPVLAKRLENIGTAAVMPLGSMIGSNLGVKTRDFIGIIIEQSKIPVVVDAGIGVPSHASEAMELGADAVLVNTAIAVAGNPILMAEAFKYAVLAGRMAFEAGKGRVLTRSEASSPLTGFLNE
ncbi:MAG: thiazole synthase [Candidatus Delongbacteria bacterium]|nr:thiazole synthase [Candidatus Delongbacteria bacterium]MBN2834620.1 thiazole synthase [Candidatus Delongbacteria bacterium]